MKIRQGFVSNSSSSSFMVGLPKGLTENQLKDFLISKMGADDNSLFYFAANNIADCILSAEPIKTKEDLIKEMYVNTWEEVDECYTAPFELCEEKGLDFRMGSAHDDAYEIGEKLFCEMDWSVNDEDFFMDKSEGY